MTTLFQRLESLAAACGDRLAIQGDDGRLTYRQLSADARSYARRFQAQGSPVVLIAVPGGPRFLAAQLGAIEAGAVVVAISANTTEREMVDVQALISPDAVVIDDPTGPIVSGLTEPADIVTFPRNSSSPRTSRAHGLPDDIRMVQLTSGSTGRPKGIGITEDNLIANLEANAEHLASFGNRPVFCPLAQFHAMGGAVVLEHVLNGRGVIVANKFVPGDDVRNMNEHKVEAIAGSPNYFRLMMRLGALTPERLPTLRSVTLGSAAVEQDLVGDLQSAFDDLQIHVRYGLSESVGALTRLDLEPGQPLMGPGLVGPLVNGSLGNPLPPPGSGDPTEIIVKSPSNATGHLLARGDWRTLTDRMGFLATGDLGFWDEHGLYVRGRTSTFLKVNGYRINPHEIEEALRSLPGVQDAVVVGPEHAVSGQRIVAVLEQGPGARIGDSQALLEACRRLLAPYKLPHSFIVFDELPRTQAGKADRSLILKEATRHG